MKSTAVESTDDEEGSCSCDHQSSTLSSATLEKWSRLAENLKGKLKLTQRENAELKERLERQSIEYDDLRDEHAFQAERIDDLEFQCLEKSAKISNLSEILETRDTNEVQEKLLMKSMEHAEMSLSVDRLRLALQKCEAANQRLLDEKDTLAIVNEELSKKVEDCTSAWYQSKKEQERNRKLLIEMGDVVRTLNCATIEFEKEQNTAGVSSCSSPNPVENIKRKIQAMEEDRQRLIQECVSLREENDSKHQRIQVLESECRSLSAAQTSDSNDTSSRDKCIPNGPLGSQLDSQTSPLSINTSILDQATDRDETDSVASEVSSFSDVPPPPDILLAEHKTLKRYYEEALERIIRMSAELSKSKVSKQEVQDKQSYIDELKERLEQMQAERDQARKDYKKIEKELEEALFLAEDTMTKHVACKKKLEQQKVDCKTIKDKYDHLEKEYSKQLGELEGQVGETEKVFEVQCGNLKKKHVDKMNALSKEKDELEKEYKDALQAEKEKIDDLNEEFDVFMEQHTQLEDDFSDLQKKYDEALTNILDLEDQVRETNATGATEKATLEKRIEEQSKTIKELKSDVNKSRVSMQEAILQQQKLRRENETVLAKHGKLVTQLNHAEERKKLGESKIKELRESCCDMENRLKRVEQEASTQFDKLQMSYQMALSKISGLIFQLHSVGLPIGEATEQETVKNCRPAVHDRIKLLEKELEGRGKGYISLDANADQDSERFHNDFYQLLKNLVQARRGDESSRNDQHLSQPFWYDRLVHQSKMTYVHQQLQNEVSSAVRLPASHTSMDFSVVNFIRYQQRIRIVLESLLASREDAGVLEIEPPSANSAEDLLNKNESFPSSMINPIFLEHQRRLTVVHYDVIARFHTTALSSESSASVVAAEPNGECNLRSHQQAQGPIDNIDDEAQWELSNLKGETQKIRIAANTAKIRYEAREKEHRVVRLQYQTLLEEYNQAVKNQKIDSSAAPDVKMAVEKIQKDEELKRLQEQLRLAELKVERMTMELRTTKSKADVAQQKQEEGEKNLQDAIGRHEELEAQQSHSIASTFQQQQQQEQHSPDVLPIFRMQQASPERRQEDGGMSNGNDSNGDRGGGDAAAAAAAAGGAASYKLVASFDGSHLTSVGGASSAEGRDERCDEENSSSKRRSEVHLEGGIGPYLQLQQDHNKALRTIDQLQSDLLDAQHSADHARSQLKHREEDLRDVIREYNQIKQESERLFLEIQEKVRAEEEAEEEGKEVEESAGNGSGGDETTADGSENDTSSAVDALVRERNMALGKISLLETELEKAQGAAKAARKKQLLREDHLRQVIGQYKELDVEHKKTKAQVEQLESSLQQYSTAHHQQQHPQPLPQQQLRFNHKAPPSPASSLSLGARLRNLTSDDEKRETPGSTASGSSRGTPTSPILRRRGGPLSPTSTNKQPTTRHHHHARLFLPGRSSDHSTTANTKTSDETTKTSDETTKTTTTTTTAQQQQKGNKAKRKPWFRDLGYSKAASQQQHSISRQLDQRG